MPEEIYLIFKTHLDVGFTGFARDVIRRYIDSYIPSAIEFARTARENNGDERFVWTTGSYLIYEFLEQSSPENRRLMEQAIEAGDIAWHALPFTTHSELLDDSMFRFGLSLSENLDRRFGKTTIAAKMTDVPGHTRSIISLLADAGVKFLHIGVNPACMPPDVPPLFIWKHPDGADIITMYQSSYGDVMDIPNTGLAIAISFTGDNQGPHSVEHLHSVYSQLQESYPGAKITATTFDACAHELLKIKDTLPVVTEEIGDTWIHGAGTDPWKVSRFRELCRMRKELLNSGTLISGSATEKAFSMPLLLVAEHTWGMDEKTHLADFENYSRIDLEASRSKENFKKIEASWAEQRSYITEAISSLEPAGLADYARERLDALEPSKPDLAGYTKVDPSERYDTVGFSIGFDASTGAINYLLDKSTNRNWVSADNSLALFGYQTFSQDDFDRFLKQYTVQLPEWAILDLTKPGMAKTGAESRWWGGRLVSLYRKEDADGIHFLAEMDLPDADPDILGFPHQLYMEVSVPANSASLDIDFQWFDKPAFRLPEAIWLSFSPVISNADGWMMEKMGNMVSPLDVVKNGNRKLHAIDRFISYEDAQGSMIIESMDAPLVAPGEPSLLNFNNEQPPLEKGMHINLYNNIWGTNFPMWYEDNAKFRFRIKFE